VYMELTKGWCKWYVGFDYIEKALTQLKEHGVTEYFVLPIIREEDRPSKKCCYAIFYYNKEE
jgi:hypothetical protein